MWELVFCCGKEQLEREQTNLMDHLKIESQIQKAEKEEREKMKLVERQIRRFDDSGKIEFNLEKGIPCMVPCQFKVIEDKYYGLNDPMKAIKPEDDEDQYGLGSASIFKKVGIPHQKALSNMNDPLTNFAL